MEEVKKIEREVFGKADYLAVFTVLFAAWSYIWGSYLFDEFFWVLFGVIYVGANFLYIKMRNLPITKESYLYAAFVLVSGICLVFCSQRAWADEIIAGFVLPLILFYHSFGIYFILTLNRNRIDNCLDERGVLDIIRGFFVIPFMHCYRLVQVIIRGMGELFPKVISGQKQHSERIKQIAIGTGIGCLILLVAVPLLMAAEESFSAFMVSTCGHLFQAGTGLFHIFRVENVIMFAIACYLYGLSYGAGKTKAPVLIKKEPRLTLAAITCQMVVCGLYLLFFIVKIVDTASIVSQGRGTFVYSEYARAGFFELCWIAFLNVVIYYLIRYMANWDNKKVKVLSTLLCVETIAFIMLAFYKMCLYIGAYGYTFKRVITSWFMVVLLVGFVLFIYQTWKRFNAVRITVWFGAVSFLVVAYGCCL